MNLSLPCDTNRLINNDKNLLLKAENLSLLFNKYVYSWRNGWRMEGEDTRKFLQDIIKSFSNNTAQECITAIINRQETMSQALSNSGWNTESFERTTDTRLILGLGGTSVIETGITLHPLYGFPYLPASGLKGLARAYAEIAADPKPEKGELKEIFGSESKDTADAANNQQGKVFFMDGMPIKFPELDMDIMNPHYGEYYQGKKDSNGNLIPPADYLNPIPVTFLAVAPGQGFSFSIYSRERDEELLNKAKEWLIGGLTELGAGGKTNVGYGYFRIDSSTVTPAKNKPVVVKEDNSMTARLKSVKNHQTFIDFVKGIKQDEMKDLEGVTFKGMESVINIGLVGTLESSEVPTEIKKTIAEKMLEICKKPDKKYPEKLEKYGKLLSMAEKNE